MESQEQICISTQSLFVCMKVQSQHWDFLRLSGWLICSDMNSGGKASSGMTITGDGSTEGPGDGGVAGSGGDLVDAGSNIGTTQ